MSYSLTPPAEALLRPRQSHAHARLWWVRRTDNFNLRLTDHDRSLTGPDGAVYTPTGGFNPTAIRRSAGLEEQNFEVVAALTSSAITHADLRAGRWDEAEINEYTVDWRYPWAALLQHSRYWITKTRFDAERVTCEVSGIPYHLSFSVGGVISRGCRADLGDNKCKVNLTLFEETGFVNVVEVESRQVTLSGVLTHSDGFFNDGEIRWTSGANVGVLSQVRTWTETPKRARLHLRTPFAIAPGDAFVMQPGCDKTLATCFSKYANQDNFRGFPDSPGTDELVKVVTR